MRTLNKIKIAIAALFVGLLCSSPLASLAQNENGVTDQGESTTKVNGSYVNENGKFVCWPRVSPNGKLLTYGPVVTTDSVNSITSTAATLYGNVVHDGWCGVIEQGFEVSTDANFTTIVARVVMNPQPSFTPCIYPACLCAGNEYHKEVTGLTAGTRYYYRAYAENPCDPHPSYGDTLEFETPGAAFIVSVTPDDAVVFCPGATGSQNLTYTVSYSPSTIPSPTFQWYFDGTEVSGVTGTTYTRTYTNSVGSHTVKCEVTSSGITRDGSVTTAVSNYTVPSLAISGDASICAGATGNLTASTGFDTYAWSSNVASFSTNNATYTAAGTYTVTATDNHGCTATANKTVTVNSPAISGTLSVSSQTICYGANATLTASFSGTSTGTLSYQWYQGSTALSGQTSSTLNLTAPTASGTYTCVLTADVNGCTVSTTSSGMLTVNHPVADIASLTASPSSVCSGETSTLTATVGSTTGTLSYQWKKGSSNVSGSSLTLTTDPITANTTYSLTQTATVGSCTATDTKSVTITVTNTSATTNNVASVTCVSATLSGSNTACSDARGFVYSSTNSTPTVGGTGCTNIPVTNGTGSFTNALSGLTPNTTYYVCAYSHSADGYVYGTVKDFTTDPITLTMSAQDKNINLCQLPHQTVVTISATPNCDESHISNYTWSLSPGAPTATYTQSSDGKTITVTVSTSTEINVSATCTLHHVSGYTNSKMDYSIIGVYGDQPEICVCEDSYNGTVTLTNPPAAQISSIVWQQQGGVGHSTSTVGLNKNDPTTPEGTYDVTITNTYGCQATRSVILGFPFARCASLGTNGSTSETTDANGVWQITDNRSANGNSSTTYRVIQIGSQCWMAENLRYKQAVDGYTGGISRTDLVNQSIYTYPIYFTWPEPSLRWTNWTAAQDWSAADVTARYGYLYTWVGAMDMPATMQTRGTLFPPEQRDYHIQGVCPDGWHLPTDGEFFQLEHELGVPRADSNKVTTCIRPDNEPDDIVSDRGNDYNAGTVAATGCDWYQNSATHCPQDYCYDVRNDRGFSAVPAGVFVPERDPIAGCFQIVGQQANFWTASQAVNLHVGHEDFSDAAYTHHITASKAGWGRYRADKHNGLSVRCVRDMVTTATPTNVTTSSATVGGTVLEDGGNTITERGICWSNTGTPSISGSHRAVASDVGSFTTTLTTSDISSGEYQYCAYAINSQGVYYGLTKTVQILAAPSVTTGSTSDVNTTALTINLHGNVTSDGGYPSTTRGICWSTTANPTTSASHQNASTNGAGAFEITAGSLVPGTTYHYRAYATNPEGTVYGEDMTFKFQPCAGLSKVNLDGYNYTTLEIGTQCWTSSLHATHYADGSEIPAGWNTTDGYVYSDMFSYYYEPFNVFNPGIDATTQNDRINVWGRLYNWQAATRGESGEHVQGLCPNGWHIPTSTEWNTLATYAQSTYGNPVTPLCAKNSWQVSFTAGTPGYSVATNNQTGFTAYPVGIYYPTGNCEHVSAGMAVTWQYVNFWCADKITYPKYVAIGYDSGVLATSSGIGCDYAPYGFSVRCVKD